MMCGPLDWSVIWQELPQGGCIRYNQGIHLVSLIAKCVHITTQTVMLPGL